MKKVWNKKKIILPIFVVIILFTAAFGYVNDYYHSDESVRKYLNGSDTVSVIEIKNGLLLDGPGDGTAMIFYPGAKVEYTAYLPLLSKLSEQGVDCFLVKMPCNLTFFGQNKTEEIMDRYDYEHWYLSGHIKNAVCLPNEEILNEPDVLPDKTQQILVYCRSGNRSKQAAQKLADMAYVNVFEFGGILDWPYPELVE